MSRTQRFFLLVLVLMLTVSTAFAASSRQTTPRGVRSFSPSGTVPENVSFRVVFTSSMVTRANIGKTITPENTLFPFSVNPPLQLEGRWQNDKIFTARLLSPLRNATTYTASLREDLRDRRGNQIGPGKFMFQTEGLSPADIRASMGKYGNAYFTLTFNMKVDPSSLKGYMNMATSHSSYSLKASTIPSISRELTL